jgi:diguanylate cyclase (GGDEF)-like protein
MQSDNANTIVLLVLTRDDATAACWAGILRDDRTEILRQWPGPDAAGPDVVVTDRAEPADAAPGDCGVVRVGGDGPPDAPPPADVRLPADCSPRELVLACRLLAQIVRLRRQQRRAVEAHDHLSRQALTDPLTGLPNRRAWEAAVLERIAAAPAAALLCLAILDIDHFKQVNDRHGHAVGDEVLRAAGRAMLDNLRQGDFVARLGGDEFGLLLAAPDAEQAAAVVERVRAALPARLAHHALPPATASAGYRVSPAERSSLSTSAAALLAAADAALREAKRTGRNRTVAG